MTAPAVATPVTTVLQRYRRSRLFVTALLFAAYVGYYFCRVTFPVALPVIRDTFSFTNTQIGLVLSAYFAVYAVSKLVNGFLGDRVGGKVMLLVGIGGTVLCNAAFGFGRELAFFVVVWAVNAFFQSIGWLSLVPIMAQWYTSRETGKTMGVMALSYQLGDFVARSSAAVLIVALGWSGLFWAHAALLALLGVMLYLSVKPSPVKLGLPDVDQYTDFMLSGNAEALTATPERPPELPTRTDADRWTRGMLANIQFWIVCTSYLFISIIRYVFWGWSVQYLIENGATLGTAAFTSAIFPLLGSAGSITAGWASDTIGARRGPVLAVMGVLLTGSVYLFSQVPGDQPVALMLALGLVGFTLYGPYSLMAGAVAMDFGWKYSSATAAGIIDAIGAVGAILTGVGMGALIDSFGWENAFAIIIGMALVSSALSFSLWNLRPSHSRTL